MTAPDARQSDELRGLIAEVLLSCLRDGNPLYYEDAADECANVLLPVVTAWAEAQARDLCPGNHWVEAPVEGFTWPPAEDDPA